MARSGGFEPPTAWFVARYSIQLSYERVEGANNNDRDLRGQEGREISLSIFCGLLINDQTVQKMVGPAQSSRPRIRSVRLSFWPS